MAYLVADCHVCRARQYLDTTRLRRLVSAREAAEWKPVGWQVVLDKTICASCAQKSKIGYLTMQSLSTLCPTQHPIPLVLTETTVSRSAGSSREHKILCMEARGNVP